MSEFEKSYNDMMKKLSELSRCVQQGRSHEAIAANIDELRKAATILRQTYNNRKDISVDVGFAMLIAEPCSTNGDDINGIVIGYADENGVWTQDLAMVSVETAHKDVATVRVWSDENNEDYTDFFAVSRYVETENADPTQMEAEDNREANAEGNNKMCLFCGCSMSGDAPDGSEVLVCFDKAGYEGKEMIVGEDECCENFN